MGEWNDTHFLFQKYVKMHFIFEYTSMMNMFLFSEMDNTFFSEIYYLLYYWKETLIQEFFCFLLLIRIDISFKPAYCFYIIWMLLYII